MADRLTADRSESTFGDYKLPLAPDQAVVEATRCLFCADAPCIKACPTAIDIPQFIRKISTGNDKGSARTIFDSNILGMSCARVCPVEVLCVGACVYNHLDAPPIQIGKLQRYATDRAFTEGWRFFEAGPDTGKSVGLIGGGPASLAAAHELRRLGHRCTIYEKRSTLGGLNVTGVAPYKMRAEQAAEEVEWVLGIGGIDVRLNSAVGEQITLESLESGHDAVMIGAGLGADSRLGVPGEDLAGVLGAVEWIERMKLARVALEGVRRCVVVGGGNTAIDAAREAKGLGIADVMMLYRGDEGGMSGYEHEWHAAKAEGVRGEWRALPVAFEGAKGVQRVRCTRLDASKKPIAGSDFTIDAELVLVAIGQSKLGDSFAKLAGVRVERGRVVTDANGFAGRAKWYAAGDCANGGKEVVNAAAEGKAAARAIHLALGGKEGGARNG
ncbi:MAG: FAD-dependent oxidoreductase [Phycisphaerales bacterium]|nr:FAD-dependent oxidoreductase [Phycisphaerales bacterium]